MTEKSGHDIQWPDGPFDLVTELDRFRKLRDTVVPADVTARMDKATEELTTSKLVDHVVGVGRVAPRFSLPNAVGEQVSLDHLLSKGPVVVSFYRGIWCPFCSLEQRSLQQHLPQIVALGASLVGISGQTPDNSLSMAQKHELTYEVLSDVGLAVARSYGLVFDLPEDLQLDYTKLGHPLPLFNGTDQWSLPLPGTFVIDSGGIIRFAYANPDYTYRADPANVLATLRTL